MFSTMVKWFEVSFSGRRDTQGLNLARTFSFVFFSSRTGHYESDVLFFSVRRKSSRLILKNIEPRQYKKISQPDNYVTR